ncbi:MAG: hypothetical protein NZT92_08070 [Abditibacteriales bacterium]|nr:hypothetical protein [Abditibacteriales bacterium]
MRYETFDRSRLRLKPLAERVHDLSLSSFLTLDAPLPTFEHPHLPRIAQRIVAARQRGSAVILVMGAHLIRAGVSRFIIDLMERGVLTHVAMNGAGAIHDFELALIGATTESVARYILSGEFGLWQETGLINEAIKAGAQDGLGMGESVGRAIAQGDFPHRDISIFQAGYRLRVPVTCHIGVGYDIIHEHPNCDGAALGATSYTDFLIFAQSVTNLEGGVLLNFGSAIMGPEVFLKALAMARNVAHQQGKRIAHFTTAVFDLVPLDEDYHREAPKTDPRYYFRPWKTLLVRTVAEGGESFYVQGEHRRTFPNLWRLIVDS